MGVVVVVVAVAAVAGGDDGGDRGPARAAPQITPPQTHLFNSLGG